MANKIPEINIGVFGHIDHGKTTLLNCLTGKFADVHSEELKRGITIKLGYANATIYKDKNKFNTEKGTPLVKASFIDVPGHEMLMANMLSGTAIIDAAILVVAANEGIKPQTREHLMALQSKNIENIIIVQNKIDLVTKEQAMKNYEILKKFVKGTVAENAPIIPVSAQQKVNIEFLLEKLSELEISKKDTESKPIFLVARSFDINRPGATIDELKGGVLGGILKKGKLKVGDEIEIKPGLSETKKNKTVHKTLTTKILSLHKDDKKVKEITPGASISIETELDPCLTKADYLTGSVVSTKGSLPEITSRINLKLNLFEKVLGTEKEQKIEPLKTKEDLMLSANTTITVGRVEKTDKDGVEILLGSPIVAIKGNTVGIARNINGHWRLIGFGEIL